MNSVVPAKGAKRWTEKNVNIKEGVGGEKKKGGGGGRWLGETVVGKGGDGGGGKGI